MGHDFQERLQMDDKVIIACPKCALNFDAPSGSKPVQVTCPKCGAVWDWPPMAEFIQEGIAVSDGHTPGTETTQQGSPKNNEGPQTRDRTHHFECYTCQYPISIP